MTAVEICVDDLAGVSAARAGGADRVEVCADLACGGLTPSFGLVEDAVDAAPVGGLQVLVRPRPGDFLHTSDEVSRIASDIRALRRLGEATRTRLGFVVGVLAPGAVIDEAAARLLRDEAEEAPLTFHRAFDLVADQDRELDRLISWGYDRVLTTGGDPVTARPERLKRLAQRAGDDLVVLVSGGLRSHNVADIARRSAAREVHMRAPGASGGTDPHEVRRIVEALAGPGSAARADIAARRT
ncbi:copper homeostasis protein CutC [Actinomyces sp. B33]|uniref:copper homeostasis protein CutC n=1 Tax=Actinomyces sp. B33 TaxID=2942131 RepID=UPI00233FA7D7|nr:copper homeostasis protein CutC [Actinomyces sp. B33]MDC4233846.1 copper homeostasis protein CutC [Actinomyces sp. B33]